LKTLLLLVAAAALILGLALRPLRQAWIRRKVAEAAENPDPEAISALEQARTEEDEVVRDSAEVHLEKVVLAAVIRQSLLRAPLALTAEYRGQKFDAQLEYDGLVTFDGRRYWAPSQAARKAVAKVSGQRAPTSGWEFWHYQDAQGERVSLETVRQAFLSNDDKD
jgi:hypothetical protein